MSKRIENFVNNYPTKYQQGFTSYEIANILLKFKKINKEKFWNALVGDTCMMINNQIIRYHCDVIKALNCGLENRDLTQGEWD